MKGIRVISSCFLMDILTLMCWAQGKAGQHIGSIVVVSGVNHSKNGENDASEPPPTPDSCKGYFDVMGQWDPPFNCSSGMFLYCCGTCGFRFCCQFRASKLDQDTCSNYDTPVWVNTNKPPPGPGPSIIDSTRNKTNLIVYIICGVVAVMVLVGIFTKLGLEKAHRPHREHMSRALADVMRQQAPNITEQTERDGNVVLPIQHYENIQPRTTTANNLFFKRHILRTDQRKDNNPSSIGLTVPEIPQAKVIFPPYTPQMNNIVQTSPILPQMSHHHSYPSMGQLSHPYEPPQPAVKELNKYASLKAVDTPPVPLKQIQPWAHSVHQQRDITGLSSGPCMPIHASRTIERDMGVERTTHRTTYGSRGSTNAVHTLNHCALADNITRDTSDWCSGRRRAEKVNEDFYAKRRHLAELAAKGSLPLHPMRPQRHEDGPYSLDRNSSKINGEKSRIAKMHSQPQVYNITYRTWDPTDQSLRRQVDTNRKHGTLEPPVSDRFGARSQHYLPPHPYFVTNSKTEVTV